MDPTDIPCASLVIAIVIVLLTILYWYFKNRNVLPGPYGVPYLGLYPFLDDESVRFRLDAYKKQYGDLYSFTYTGRLFINLGSVKAMRELHINKSDCFSGRFTDFNPMLYMLQNGVVMLNGDPWKVLRKFFIQRFKEHGLNTVRDHMAGPVYDSLAATVEDLKALQGKPFNLLDVINQRCAVTMRKVIFGESGVTDEEIGKMCSLYGESLEGMTGVNIMLIGPFARLLSVLNPRLNKALKQHGVFRKLLLTCAKRIESKMDQEHTTCIIEDYCKERNEKRRNNDPDWKIYTDDSLVDSILQFVGDGIVGVAAFIGGFLYVLMEYPGEQEKLYKELMEVVGPNRQPVLEDKPNLPYLSAFMNEVLRENSFLQMFPSLECTKETTIRGYRIPKGAITLLNFWSAHHDPNTFEDPHTFNPSRYLPNPDKPKPELPVTFGMGKRSCSGESFVIMQSFLFLATIVKNFKIISATEDATNKGIDFFLSGKLELILQPRTEN